MPVGRRFQTTETGFCGPGIRARAGRLEGYAKVFYVGREGVLDQFGVDTEGWIFKPGVVFRLTENFALKLSGDVGELDTAVSLGARLHF